MASAPALSVVVIVLEGPDRLRSCLDGLRRQRNAPAIEVIVPWDGTHGCVAPLREEFQEAEFLLEKGPKTYAQLRAIGVAKSRAPIIATTEDHCTPDQYWTAAICECHAAPHAVIGGAVEKEEPDTVVNWAMYLADYLRYSAPKDGPSRSLTDGNVSYKRSAIEPLRNVWSDEFHENVIHAVLGKRGESLWLSPRIVVRQKRAVPFWAALRERYEFGRLFASTRVSEASLVVRLGYLASSVPLPALLLVRITLHVFRNTRYAVPFIRAFPVLVLISAVWAAGEFAGYLTRRPGQRLKRWRHDKE